MDKTARILIVDDDVDTVEAMRTLLESRSYEVIAAYDGEQGLEKARSEFPDIVLLDIMMTTIDQGFHVGHAIKNDPDLSDIKVIILTGLTEKTGFRFAPDTEWLPADDYLEKPIDPDELLKRIGKLLST